jgi:D-glycero-alpha-D-manno-heptose-7-phosphate kinase
MLMIITRTPFRISFLGGGTDYPAWYRENGGAVLSSSIDKYCYINCRYWPPFFKEKFRVVYSRIELINKIEEIQHPSIKACLKFMHIDRGIEVTHNADLPARAGLGSSSAFTVGLLHALNGVTGKIISKRQLALDAIDVEQNIIKEHVGSQDQTQTAFGGINVIKFGGNQKINVLPLTISNNMLKEFESHLMLFYTGISRYATEIAKGKIASIKTKKSDFKTLGSFVDEGVKILSNNSDLDLFGKLLNESWKIKRALTASISNETIDDAYSVAIKAGASGGKLLGAGGGGFLLMFASPCYHKKVREALKSLLYVPFSIEFLGSQIVYYMADNE